MNILEQYVDRIELVDLTNLKWIKNLKNQKLFLLRSLIDGRHNIEIFSIQSG